MGSCFSSDSDNEKRRDQNRQSSDERHHLFPERKRTSSNLGIGMGVAMMMQSALVGGASMLHLDRLEGEIRKAKAEGRTVTLINGCLYFDYQLVAQVPPHFDLNV